MLPVRDERNALMAPLKIETVDIDTMPAGREMDALVAEKVMGWEFAPELTKATGSDCWMEWNEDKSDYRVRGCWIPSASIAAAWEVVEKLKHLGFTLGFLSNEDERLQWDVSFGPNGMSEKNCVYEDTAPLAICRAALKVKEQT